MALNLRKTPEIASDAHTAPSAQKGGVRGGLALPIANKRPLARGDPPIRRRRMHWGRFALIAIPLAPVVGFVSMWVILHVLL